VAIYWPLSNESSCLWRWGLISEREFPSYIVVPRRAFFVSPSRRRNECLDVSIWFDTYDTNYSLRYRRLKIYVRSHRAIGVGVCFTRKSVYRLTQRFQLLKIIFFKFFLCNLKCFLLCLWHWCDYSFYHRPINLVNRSMVLIYFLVFL